MGLWGTMGLGHIRHIPKLLWVERMVWIGNIGLGWAWWGLLLSLVVVILTGRGTATATGGLVGVFGHDVTASCYIAVFLSRLKLYWF